MLSLGPAVSVNVEREVCELPVKSTAETGYEVNQSDSQRSSSSVAVFLSPHPALANSSKARQDTDELPFHQQEITLNDTASIVQHNNTDCKQFEGAVEQGLSEPRNSVCVESIVQHDGTDCKQFEGEVEQGLSVPRNEVNNDGVCNESVENVTGINGAVSLYSNPVQTGPSQSEIQSAEVYRRPARVAARQSGFRDDQFETQFHPGLKDRVRQVHFNPGKGEQNGSKLGNSKQIGPVNNSLIQSPNGNYPYLIRKKGYKFGWPTWPKIRFKCHSKNRWKSRFRALSRRSIRFAPHTGICKLSRGAFRVRMLNRLGTIRFRTQNRPGDAPRPLLRSKKAESRHPLSNGTFQVRTLNRSSSAQSGSSMFHLQSSPVHDHPLHGNHPLHGKPEIHECKSIQAVIPHPHQFDVLQISAKSRGNASK